MIITLQNSIHNSSLQVNDEIYYAPISNTIAGQDFAGNPILVGTIDEIGGTYVSIPDRIGIPYPAYGSFLMFSKDKISNNTSLIGYYAEVTLKNNSKEKAELFTLSSEVTESSK